MAKEKQVNWQNCPIPRESHSQVNSSNIKSLAYQAEFKTLEVVFWTRDGKPGPIWRYYPVEKSEFQELLKATSVGALFARVVKVRKDIASFKMP